ncbi:MAG: MFS transporter [Candidatus Lokiarchaeota archaeon]|nr:MFS transporter [Candidatus Lokiarchaeota archaeon]
MSDKNLVRAYTRKDKAFWGLAQLGTSLFAGVYGAALVIFFHVYLELDPFYIGVSAWIYAIWNALNDPIFGYLSDKTASKKGRRIPYMRYTAPFLALFFILLWLVPTGFDQVSIFLWMVIFMLLYDTGYTIIGLVYSALLPELTEDDKVRGEFQTSSSLFYLLGTILGFLLPDLVKPEVGSTELLPFYITMIIIAIIGAIAIITTTFKFKERPEFTIVDTPLSLGRALKYTFRSKAFLVVTSANFMSIFFQQMLLSYMLYVATFVLQTSSILLLAFLFLGLIVGVLLANKLAKRFGYARANQILLFLGSIALILLTFLPDVAIYPCLFIAGIGLAGPLVLTNVLYAQVADEDETKTGVRREAAFFGTNAMLTKPAQSIAIGTGPALLAMAGFVTGQVTQGPTALLMIKVLIGLLPGIVMLVGVLILFLYPLKGEYLEKIQKQVLEMHEEKHSKLLDMEGKSDN